MCEVYSRINDGLFAQTKMDHGSANTHTAARPRGKGPVSRNGFARLANNCKVRTASHYANRIAK